MRRAALIGPLCSGQSKEATPKSSNCSRNTEQTSRQDEAKFLGSVPPARSSQCAHERALWAPANRKDFDRIRDILAVDTEDLPSTPDIKCSVSSDTGIVELFRKHGARKLLPPGPATVGRGLGGGTMPVVLDYQRSILVTIVAICAC